MSIYNIGVGTMGAGGAIGVGTMGAGGALDVGTMGAIGVGTMGAGGAIGVGTIGAGGAIASSIFFDHSSQCLPYCTAHELHMKWNEPPQSTDHSYANVQGV